MGSPEKILFKKTGTLKQVKSASDLMNNIIRNL